MAAELSRSVRIGYGSGSVATGAFGTVALLIAFLDRLSRPVRS